jgi:hypothetical protein
MLIKFIIKIKNCTQSPDLKKINKKPRSKFKDTKTSFELLVVTYNKLTAKGRFTKKVNFR